MSFTFPGTALYLTAEINECDAEKDTNTNMRFSDVPLPLLPVATYVAFNTQEMRSGMAFGGSGPNRAAKDKRALAEQAGDAAAALTGVWG